MKKQRRKTSRYFERFKEEYGKDWINVVQADELIKGMGQFYKDLVFGAVDSNVWGYVFTNQNFMSAFFWKLTIDIRQIGYIVTGLEMVHNNSSNAESDSSFVSLYQHYKSKQFALQTIYSSIYQMCNDGNFGWLVTIANNCKQVRFDV